MRVQESVRVRGLRATVIIAVDGDVTRPRLELGMVMMRVAALMRMQSRDRSTRQNQHQQPDAARQTPTRAPDPAGHTMAEST